MFGRVSIILFVAAFAWLALARGSNEAGHQKTVTVQAGQTLWAIASATYAGDTREGVWKLEQLNHLHGDTLVPGQRLVVP